MRRSHDPQDSDDLVNDLAEALAAIPQDRQPAVPTAPSRRQRMALPPGLVEEAARLLFEFWEREAERGGHRPAIGWERLSSHYQMAWLEITRIVLEMSTHVLLTDLNRFLDHSNGDMGAAFSRAVQRYAAAVLQCKIGPS